MMSSSHAFSHCVFSFLVILSIFFPAQAQSQGPEPSPEKKQLLQERDTHIRKAITFFEAKNSEKGMAHMQEALAIEKKVYGPSHAKVLERMELIALGYEMFGMWKSAKEMLGQVVKIQHKVHGKDHWRTQDAQRAVKDLSFREKLTPQQRERLSQAAQLHKQVIQLYQNGKKQQARTLANKTLKIRLDILGEKHPDYALSLINLGVLLKDLKEFTKALTLFNKGLAIYKQTLGEKHPEYASGLNHLANMYSDQKRYDKAYTLYQESLAIRKESLGEKHSDFTESLNNLALLYKSRKQYDKALPLYNKSLAITKEILGEKHLDFLITLNSVAALYKELKDFEKALPLYQKALTIRKAISGEKHPEYLNSLINIAILFRSLGKYNQALSFYLEHLKLKKDTVGEKHPDYATALSEIAYLYHGMGDYAKSLPLSKKVLALREEILGEKHPQYATSLNNLAILYSDQGYYRKALPLLERALAITKERLGTKHSNYAISLKNLGNLYRIQAEYEKALSLLNQAITLEKELLGEKHPNYAATLNHLAELYTEQGEYGKALPLYQQLQALYKEIYGERHPRYCASLGALASLYKRQGEYFKALNLYMEAARLVKKVFGSKHPNVATFYDNVGQLAMSMGKYDRAISWLKEALAIRKESLGETHSSYSNSLSSLANLYHSQGDDEKALPLYQQSLAIKKEALGEKHPDYATNLLNIAQLYRSQGDYDKALQHFQQILAIYESTVGKTHPYYIRTLQGLAKLYFVQGDYNRAEKYYREGAITYLQYRRKISQDGLQRASHADRHSDLGMLVSLLAKNGKPLEAWHWLEQSLGRATFDEVTARKNRSEEEQQQLDQLQGSIHQTVQRLQKMAVFPKLSEDQKKLQKQLLSEQVNLYSQLAESYKQLESKYGLTEGKSFSLKKIQSALTDDTAFLTWVSTRYALWAVIVRSKGEPIFRQLRFQKKELTLEEMAIPLKLYNLLQSHRQTNANEQQALFEKLQKQRIEPITEQLKDIKHVILLPSELMDKFPVELLLPEKKVSYAPSATMYAYLHQQPKAAGNRFLALGDPIFNPQEELKEQPVPEGGVLIISVTPDSAAAKADLQANQVLLAYDGTPVNNLDALDKAKALASKKKEVRIKVWEDGKTFEKVIATGPLGVVASTEPAKIALMNRRKQLWQFASRGEVWKALPGTRIEVASIANLIEKTQRTVLLDSLASEQQLHQLAITGKLKEYHYLHFATHGELNPTIPMESALILSRDKLTANVAELNPNQTYFDGRLTAKEVALHWTLDADLVTLSACHSGLGKHARGEGYMGFAQSFLIRGSRSVVLSLWSVDDTATALLMSRFYENLIKKQMSKIDSLREAKKWLRNLSRNEVLKLTARMSNGVARGPGRKKLPPLSKVPMSDKAEAAPYAHPYYWSAFILIGDPH